MVKEYCLIPKIQCGNVISQNSGPLQPPPPPSPQPSSSKHSTSRMYENTFPNPSMEINKTGRGGEGCDGSCTQASGCSKIDELPAGSYGYGGEYVYGYEEPEMTSEDPAWQTPASVKAYAVNTRREKAKPTQVLYKTRRERKRETSNPNLTAFLPGKFRKISDRAMATGILSWLNTHYPHVKWDETGTFQSPVTGLRVLRYLQYLIFSPKTANLSPDELKQVQILQSLAPIPQDLLSEASVKRLPHYSPTASADKAQRILQQMGWVGY